MSPLDPQECRQVPVFVLGGKTLPLDPALLRKIAAETDHGRRLDSSPERIAAVIETFVDQLDAAADEDEARVLIAKLHIVCHAAAVCGVTRHPPAGAPLLTPFETGSHRVH